MKNYNIFILFILKKKRSKEEKSIKKENDKLRKTGILPHKQSFINDTPSYVSCLQPLSHVFSKGKQKEA